MNPTQPTGQNLDPNVFAVWVANVADANEMMSETLRETADAVATMDVDTAMELYRAADKANDTVYKLRQSMPRQTTPTVKTNSSLVVGVICVAVGMLLGRL